MTSRVDLTILKSRLNGLLGEGNREQYWKALKDYLHGRISKRELDDLADRVVGKKFCALHNQFIKGIHHNAQLSLPPPPQSVGPSSALNSQGAEDLIALRHFISHTLTPAQVKATLADLTDVSPNNNASLPLKVKTTGNTYGNAHHSQIAGAAVELVSSEMESSLRAQNAAAAAYNSKQELFVEERVLDFDLLRSRMQEIATTFQLSGVYVPPVAAPLGMANGNGRSPSTGMGGGSGGGLMTSQIGLDPVACMSQALEVYLKNILSAVLHKTRPLHLNSYNNSYNNNRRDDVNENNNNNRRDDVNENNNNYNNNRLDNEDPGEGNIEKVKLNGIRRRRRRRVMTRNDLYFTMLMENSLLAPHSQPFYLLQLNSTGSLATD
jgi:hypothetical protein